MRFNIMDAVILDLNNNGMFDRVTGEELIPADVDVLLDAGRKVFVSFGGEPVEVVKVDFKIIE